MNQGVAPDLQRRAKARGVIRKMGEQLDWNTTRFSGITVDQAQLIQARFGAGNDAFATKVWNRSWADIYGEESTSVPPFNVFRRESASPQERTEFDEVVEMAWQSLNFGKRGAIRGWRLRRAATKLRDYAAAMASASRTGARRRKN